MWQRKTKSKEKLKNIIRFHSANKIHNYNRGEVKGKGKKERKKEKYPKESTEQVNT